MLQPNCDLLTDSGELRDVIAGVISQAQPTGFDIETGYEGLPREKASLHPEENFIAGISFTNSLDWARYVPLRHDSGLNADNVQAAELFWRLLTARDSDGEPLGVAHGAKFERRTMARWFLRLLAGHPQLGSEVIACRGYPLIRSCTLLESYAEAANRTHGLKEITWQNYSYPMATLLSLFPDLTQKEAKCIRFNVLDQHDPKVISYACEDSIWCLRHHLDRYSRVKNSPSYQVEMAVLREVVCDMEDTGVDYDWHRMREAAIAGKDFADRYLFEVGRDFESWLGRSLPPKFNFGSSQQLAKLLFDTEEGLGLPVRHKTPAGKPSVNAKTALKGLSVAHKPVERLLEWKSLTKLHRDFLEAYEAKYSWAPDGRAHPSLIQHGTVTGRTSAADMNYQQSPKKYKYKLSDGSQFVHSFRDNIRAPLPGMRQWWQLILQEQGLWQPDSAEDELGWYFLGFDWSQMELRVIAGEAGETTLLEAYMRGDDVHRLTASLVRGRSLEQVTEEDRAVGKTLGFALVYNMTEEGLAERLGISREEAAELFARFHAAYPRIRVWMERTIESARRNGYVVNKFGRVVRIWEYQDADNMDDAWAARNRRRAGDRTAGNAPIQGAATGDYKKISMVRTQRALRDAGLDDRVLLVMDVHDEMAWYVRKDVPPAQVIAVLQPEVTWEVEGWPPMVAEWHVGERWGSVAELDLLPDGSVRPRRKAEVPEAAPGEEPGAEEEDFVSYASLREGMPVARAEALGRPVAQGDVAGHLLPGDLLAGSNPAPPAPHREPRTVYVELAQIPGPEEAARFTAFLCQMPGSDTVILRCAGYPDFTVMKAALGPQHGPQVAMILGGALVYYALDSVDMAQLASGLGL